MICRNGEGIALGLEGEGFPKGKVPLLPIGGLLPPTKKLPPTCRPSAKARHPYKREGNQM